MLESSFQILESVTETQELPSIRNAVEFCPKCGKLLKITNRKGAPLLSCPKCRYKKLLNQNQTAKHRIHHGRPSEIAVIAKDEESSLRPLPTVNVICPTCGKSESETWVVALGGEVPSSTVTFFRCTKCGKTRREVG
ncbi:MAG: RPA12/RPB9/RPC11 RNA polymerase family protein [Candidatus Bathyarchaeota archaeon]|nr:RPA12/RPB9/RPC11 RNA polymerase family protein [Candidatus Bathyarchaeota archaeon]